MSLLSFRNVAILFLFFSACTEPVDTSGSLLDAGRCSDSEQCGVCEVHSDCASQVCDSEGECMAADDIIYVSVDGTNYEGCGTKTEPCSRFDVALDLVDEIRSQIVIAEGLYTQRLVVDEKHVEVLGVGEVMLEPSLQNRESAAYVEGFGKLNLENVSLRGAGLETGSTFGVRCNSSLGDQKRPELNLSEVRIAKFSTGVEGTGCKRVTIVDSFVESNNRTGIKMAEVTNVGIERTFVALNQNGINIVDSVYSVLNSFIVKNERHGVLLQSSISKAEKMFAFNTVAHNGANWAGEYLGVDCVGETATLLNSIIVGEDSNTVAVSGNCRVDGVLAHPRVHGDNMVHEDPLFVDPENMNFALQTSSPAIDAAGNDPAPRLDFDGELRPKGAAYDIGADEAL